MRDERTVSRYVRQLIALGLLERERVGWKRWRITVVRTDGARDYTQIDRRWLCRDLSANGIGLSLLLAAVANGRETFVTERKVLEKMSRLSRNSLASLLSEIENQGLVRLNRGISNTVVLDLSFLHWTLPKKSRSSPNFAQKVAVLTPNFAQKVAGEEDKPKNLEEYKSFKNLEDKNNTGVKHDQRRAETRADAVATIPIILPSEDQNQNQSAAVSQEAPPTHNDCTCVQGWLYMQDDKGRTVTKRCKRWLAWVKYQQAVEKEAAEAAEETRLRAQGGPFSFFSFDIFARPSAAPALPPAPASPPAQTRTIEGEWRERPPVPAPDRDPGDIMSAAMFAECWTAITLVCDVTTTWWDESTRKRVNGLLRKGEVARFGAERFHKALYHVCLDQWEIKHGNCRECMGDDDGCDGSCGHNPDECNGPACHEPKRLLDLVGHAIQHLRQDAQFGRDCDTGCPNPIYRRMYAA